MADKGMTLAIVLLIAGLIVGGGIGYFAAPTKIVGTDVNLNHAVSPIYTSTLPNDLSKTMSFRVDSKHIMYIWQETDTGGTYWNIYWTYVTIGN